MIRNKYKDIWPYHKAACMHTKENSSFIHVPVTLASIKCGDSSQLVLAEINLVIWMLSAIGMNALSLIGEFFIWRYFKNPQTSLKSSTIKFIYVYTFSTQDYWV